MRRFLGYWILLSPTYLAVAALSSWLFLNLIDLTYEAFAAWLLVPVAQALVLAATSRRAPLRPPGRPPLVAFAPVVLGLGLVIVGLFRPLDTRWGFVTPGNLQALLPRFLAIVAAAALLVAALGSRGRRTPIVALGALLLVVGLDAVHPFISTLPGALFPKLSPFLAGLITWGVLVALLFVTTLAAQSDLQKTNPWAARLAGASLAVLFGALHGALLQLFLHPWLEGRSAILVPAAVSVSAALAAAAGLAALATPREGP